MRGSLRGSETFAVGGEVVLQYPVEVFRQVAAMSLYESEAYEYLLDHYENPRNYGTLEDADISYEEGNPSCGDVIRIDVRTQDDRIADIRFSGKGCVISQASASILTELVKGKTLQEVRSMTKEDVLQALGIPISAMRLKCALLGLKVLKAGLYGIHRWPDEE
jgi:nitrogen fixation NifU-like protein